MTRKVDNQRSRRERARAIKEEKRRKGRMRVDRSRATRSPNDAEDPMTIYGSEQEENDGNVMDERRRLKFNRFFLRSARKWRMKGYQ